MSTQGRNGDTTRRRLVQLSDSVLTNSGYIAGETDRWFLATVRGAHHCVDRTRQGLGAVSSYITTKTWVSRLPGVRKRSAQERLRRAILVEAKRAGIRLEDPEFAAFAERISVLLELVLEGSIAAAAIDFEEGPTEPEETDALANQASAADSGAEPGANSVSLPVDGAPRN